MLYFHNFPLSFFFQILECEAFQNILPSVKFPNFVSCFSCLSCFSWEKKEEKLGKSCSIRTALSRQFGWRSQLMASLLSGELCERNQPSPAEGGPPKNINVCRIQRSFLAPNELVCLTYHAACTNLSFNHPSVVLTADVFQFCTSRSMETQ